MNKENQNIEWKASWRDEYLKWICGFANAQGGKMYIGKKDNGEIVGLSDAADLAFQDEIHGHLFDQVEKTMELLLTKYLKAYIRYERLNRIEEYPIPEAALREAILNAVAHKDYSGQTPIQIRVYENRLMIWNQGQLPDNWTIEKLLQTHPSVPYNPAIANVFFKAGLIEAWGLTLIFV